MHAQFRCSGFTLIELLVVVALVAILQLLAVPALVSMATSMNLTTAVNSLFSSLILARSEAIKRNSRAVVCKSGNGNTCITTGGWEQGWIVFHDVNNNASLGCRRIRFIPSASLSATHPIYRQWPGG